MYHCFVVVFSNFNILQLPEGSIKADFSKLNKCIFNKIQLVHSLKLSNLVNHVHLCLSVCGEILLSSYKKTTTLKGFYDIEGIIISHSISPEGN